MRPLVASFAALILLVPLAAGAQQRNAGQQRPSPPPTMPPLRPSVPPPIVNMFPPLMPPPPGGLTPRFGENPPFRTRQQRFFPFGSTAYAPFVFGYQESVEASGTRSQSPAAVTGLLRLAVTPPGAQVFVDSYYVGTVDDVNAQRALELEAGPHRIEFRAPQYQTLTVDVRVLPYETVTYRGALEPTRPQAQAAPAAGAATVMYVIPRCYAGNTPPRQNRLPSGCDIKQVQVLTPPAAPSRR
jgi:hypothetical protein